MARDKNTFAKRQRETKKRQKAEEKRVKRQQRKDEPGVDSVAEPEERPEELPIETP